VNPDFASYPLLNALKERRSRRVCHGMEIPDGPLQYRSRATPVPLTEKEESLLAFAACGVTGCALADLPFGETSGGNIMAGLIGRTIASGDGIQTVSLIIINDSGAFLYRRPQELGSKSVREMLALADKKDFEGAGRLARVQICDERPRTPIQPIFNINVNRWSAHAKGTTYFLPVNEMTFMYINGLLEVLNEHTGLFVLDERANFRPAGIGRFAKSKGGHLHDDPADGRISTIALVERLVTEFVTVEQGMMLQNLGLMAEALGLGGFPNFANHDFAWFQALEFTMQNMPASRYLGMGMLPATILKLLGKDSTVPMPLSLERNGEALLRPWTPPYFKNMREAVEAVVAHKSGNAGVFRGGSACAWTDPEKARSVPAVSEKAIAATIAYCEYVWNRYCRFPAHFPPFRTVLGFQSGHLDLEFYERFYPGSAISDTIRKDAATR
jgi:hypothetical protein